jgi:hypothetical protein
MEEDEIYEVDPPEGEPTDDRPEEVRQIDEVIGTSPVESFFRDFEERSQGNPFRTVKQVSKQFGEMFATFGGGTSEISSAARGLFGHLSNRLIESAPRLNRTFEEPTPLGSSLDQELEGFLSRGALQFGERDSHQLTSGFISRGRLY